MYIYEDETGFVILTLYVDDILFLSASKILLNKLEKGLMDRFEMFDVSDVSRSLGIDVTREREKRAIITSQKDYMEGLVQRQSMDGRNLACAPGVGLG